MRRVGPSDIVQGRVHRRIGVGADDPLLVLRMSGGFFRGDEPGAEDGSVSPKREHRGQSASIGDPTGGKQGQIADRIAHLRNQHQRRDRSAHVPSGLESLRHHCVRARILRPPCFLRAAALPDDLEPGVAQHFDRRGMLAGVAQKKVTAASGSPAIVSTTQGAEMGRGDSRPAVWP